MKKLAERVEQRSVIFDQCVALGNLLRRHPFDDLFLRNRRVRIAADRAENVPHIRAHQIGCGHADAKLIVPANPRLRARMAFQRRPQIPLKRALFVLFNTKAARVQHANQFLGLCIARLGRRQKGLQGFFKTPFVHKVAPGFDFRHRRGGDEKGDCKNYLAHGFTAAFLGFASMSQAETLPQPLQPSDFIEVDLKQAELGRLLFYDPILSGNRNISCGTCHAVEHGTSDGLSLGIGEGGAGVGPERTAGEGRDRIKKRTPRNAPALWNLGAREIRVMFHDGRVEPADFYDNGFNTPAQERLPEGLNGILAVLALFPLTAQFEMAGDPGENDVAGAVYDRIDNVWPIIAKRVRLIPEYAEKFVAAFDDVDASEDVRIAHIANALAAFQAFEYQSYDSPFDDFLNGETHALSPSQQRGMALFYGDAGCSACHSGPLFTDQEFHAIALPMFGPGRTRVWDPIARDVGRMAVSDRREDAYRFRTPSLRNVALSGPYGHNGAYRSLEGIVRHHLAPASAFANWEPSSVILPDIPWLNDRDFLPLQDQRERARIAAAIDLKPMSLTDTEVSDIVAFLKALTGTESLEGRFGKPETVPSGLPVD